MGIRDHASQQGWSGGSHVAVICSAGTTKKSVYGVSQEDIAAYGREHGTKEYMWRACLIPCRLVFEKGNHSIPIIGGFLRDECKRLFRYKAG